MLTLVKKCRVCNREPLKLVLDLGNQHLSGQFVRDLVEAPTGALLKKYPLKLVRCNGEGCGLVQLGHSVDPGLLFNTYWYRSGVNDTMKNHLKKVAEDAFWTLRGSPTSILDIGCNDGTLLRAFKEISPNLPRLVGIDPSDALRDSWSTPSLYQGFFPKDLPGDEKNFDLIFSLACFYDIEDPVAFAKSILTRLSFNGVWVVEVAYLTDILTNRAYDTICHEHLEYYSLRSLENIFGCAGLTAFHVQKTPTNGGSLLLYVCRKGTYDVGRSVVALREEEWELYGTNRRKLFDLFSRGVRDRLDDLYDLMKQLHREGKRVHVYGASTKGNVILQAANIVDYIECCADRNPAKWGCRTLGTNLPIISEEDSRKLKPDYYLVLPWAFREEFILRERDSGIPMIFPLPNVSVWLNKPGDGDGGRKVEHDQDPFYGRSGSKARNLTDRGSKDRKRVRISGKDIFTEPAA